jgi:hypothetical protein
MRKFLPAQTALNWPDRHIFGAVAGALFLTVLAVAGAA